MKVTLGDFVFGEYLGKDKNEKHIMRPEGTDFDIEFEYRNIFRSKERLLKLII